MKAKFLFGLLTLVGMVLSFQNCQKSKNQLNDSLTIGNHLSPGCGPIVGISCDSPQYLPNDSGLPACTDEQVLGAGCSLPPDTAVCFAEPGFTCPEGGSMPATLLSCVSEEPVECPISIAAAKEKISYLSQPERKKLSQAVLQLKLASYNYKPQYSSDQSSQIGFIIEDLPENSPLVMPKQDRVNLYAYISSVVATVQEQDRTIQSLQQELAQVKNRIEQK